MSSDDKLPKASKAMNEPKTPIDGPERPSLPPHIQGQIGKRLAAMYDEILQQPVPDRFRLLLDQLDRDSAETAREPSNGEGAL